MTTYNTKKLILFYEQNVIRYKNNIKALAWGSRMSQEKRFEILSQISDIEGKSILDVGCGLGDFYKWLKLMYKNIDYTGIDISPSMIDAASANFPEADFEVLDIIETDDDKTKYDYVFASGIFNRRIPNHWSFVCEAIKKMYLFCNYGVAFNVMSTKADFMEKEEFYAEPGKILKFCLSLSRKSILRHDYMPHDFTVFIYKEGYG